MFVELGPLLKALPANGAHVGLHARVDSQVVYQVALLVKLSPTGRFTTDQDRVQPLRLFIQHLLLVVHLSFHTHFLYAIHQVLCFVDVVFDDAARELLWVTNLLYYLIFEDTWL